MNILMVDMSRDEVHSEPFPLAMVKGGRGMLDHLMTTYGLPTAHPLSPESIFIAAPGLFAGTSAPQSGRLSVGGKSPLTGCIREANSGGTAAHKIGRLGIAAIMVKGKSDKLRLLRITPQGAALEDAGDMRGMANYAACDRLRERYGSKVSIIIVGPAGEMKLANSTVAVTDTEGRPCRHAARGGVGAMMGAKGLKAIVIDDAGGELRQAARQEAFRKAVKAAAEAIRSGPFTDALHQFGTAVFVDLDNARGSLPAYNYRMGSFDKVANMSASKFVETVTARGGKMGHGCMPGCVVRCSSVYRDSSGSFVTAALEYETLGLLGSNLGIDDLDAIARLDRRCDELGIDTIETGSTIGILNEVGLFDFGDAAQAEILVEEIARGSHLGRILGSGVAEAAKVFGIERVPAVKGLALPAHAARSSKGWGVTYATSPQGADHTAGPVLEDPLSAEGQAARSRMSQIVSAAFDATGLCNFTFLAEQYSVVVPMINALYGVDWTEEDYLGMGMEMLRQERAFNLKAGIGPGADRLPGWMSVEPLPPNNTVFDVPADDLDSVFNF